MKLGALTHLGGLPDHESVLDQLTNVLSRVRRRNLADLCIVVLEKFRNRRKIIDWSNVHDAKLRDGAGTSIVSSFTQVARTSLGSIQIFLAPQFSTDAASRFCNLSETMVNQGVYFKASRWLLVTAVPPRGVL